MLQELRAGRQLDVLTKSELKDALREWQLDTMRGARPVRFDATGTITAAGALTVGGKTLTGQTGPAQGYMWLVRRLAVTGLSVAADPTSVYINGTEPQHCAYPNLTGAAGATGYKAFNSGELVLQGEQALIVYGTGLVSAAGTLAIVTGAALEFPVTLAWKYLG